MFRIRKGLKHAFSKRKFSTDPRTQADRETETVKPYRDDWWKEHMATQRRRELKALVE